MKYNIILRNGNYALLDAGTQYIVACDFDETQREGEQWGHGTYFTHWNQDANKKQQALSSALEYFRLRTETDYIPRCRLEELTTQFKDGLIEDDEEQALIYFDEVCEMSESEKEFFGIETESEEEEYEEEYCPSSTNGDYSPSCPWNAPGMSIKDFI